MNIFNNAVVLSLNVFLVEFQKKETVSVPGRDFYSLTFRMSGKISITAKEKTVISSHGGITFVPKGADYTTEVLESGNMIAVHFELSEEAGVMQDIIAFEPERGEVFSNLFTSLLKRYTPDESKGFGCMSIFYNILSELSRENSGNDRVSNRMTEVRRFINKNFTNTDLSVELLARRSGVSEVYLRREFKKAFALSPLAYIKKVRFDNAKAMLETGYYSVSEVAEKCGFTSPGYFSCAFHKEFGISPSDYRDLR